VNPWSSTVAEYRLGCRPVMRYEPDSVVTVERELPVSRFTTVTVAPGSAAPVESFTVPAIAPVCS